MLFSIFPFTFIPFSITPFKYTLTMLFIIKVFSYISFVISPYCFSSYNIIKLINTFRSFYYFSINLYKLFHHSNNIHRCLIFHYLRILQYICFHQQKEEYPYHFSFHLNMSLHILLHLKIKYKKIFLKN